MPRLATALGLLFGSLVGGNAASAQAIDDFRPAIDSRGYLTLNAAQVLDHMDMSFGLGSLEWGRNLVPSSVDNLVSATLVGAVGVRVGLPFELGVSLPLTIMNGAYDGQGVGDFGAHLKAHVAQLGPIGLGALASVYIPTSNDPFLGERSTTPQFVAIADATFGRLRLAVNGGIRFRRTTTFMDMAMNEITTSSELPMGVAAAYGLIPEKVELIAELFGAIPIGAHQGYQPLEALGGVKLYLAKSSYLSLGAGRGLVPDAAGNPDFRGTIGIVFEPKPAQRTHAQIPDEVIAQAPPAHDDGLGDRDNDGILDRDDKCPDDMEDYDGVDDEDGCPEPDRGRVITGKSEIITLQPIEFEFDKDILRDSAYPILDEVIKAIQDNGIALVEVQGHTDEQGDDGYNLDLSKRRAATVKKYLLDHGIESYRLQSQGYGETRPVDARHTQEAYTKNRRVAFKILKRI